jgi:hypothetical protein
VVSTTVRWSAQASSRRRASSSTGGVRLQLHTKKPVAAAQNPPTIHRTFFIAFGPLLRCDASCLEYDALRGSDGLDFCRFARPGCGAFVGMAGTATLWVWIRFDLDGCWGSEPGWRLRQWRLLWMRLRLQIPLRVRRRNRVRVRLRLRLRLLLQLRLEGRRRPPGFGWGSRLRERLLRCDRLGKG